MNMELHKRKAGMTLIEVLMVVVLGSLVIIGVYAGISLGTHLNYASAQRLAAFSLCRDLYEQMRGADYTNVTAVVFPTTTMRLTHLGGSQHLPQMCTRSCTIDEMLSPTRKVVNITVSWNYMGNELQESLDGVIYQKR